MLLRRGVHPEGYRTTPQNAKDQITGDRPLVPFIVTSSYCVKLMNSYVATPRVSWGNPVVINGAISLQNISPS